MKTLKYISADEAVKLVQSGDRIYIQAAAATPTILTDALARRASELKNVEISHILTSGEAAYANPALKDSFYVNSFFLSANVRHIIKEGIGSYTPVFLSELPKLFYNKIVPIDGVLVSVSPPDKHGYCSLGTSVEATWAAIKHARYVIAQVNENMPRTFGDTMLHISQISALVEHHSPLYSLDYSGKASEVEEKIAKNVVELIEDDSTIQIGIGSIPDAVLRDLVHLKNLGVHTELLTDGVVNLVEKGVITGSKKGIDVGKIVCTFMFGSKKLYDFANDNPNILVRESQYTNNPHIIAQNPKMISVNSAIEVDVTGQVCADSIGTRMYSGVGGQIDFVRGASQSAGGKAIIALPSTARSGESRIVPFLKQGAGVVTSRFHIQYVVTEYGVADLRGKTLAQRQKLLIDIAHPKHRENIEKTFYDVWAKDNL
ncbi:MAG: acetyl-CoA hydrolase/transferase C-terminal domain-containing protein [Capnocytophaga sp.]|nr:acetyl-CoA hydrolase/transferase C-terminal domain-containing protein [Capnocytophaga sp.]